MNRRMVGIAGILLPILLTTIRMFVLDDIWRIRTVTAVCALFSLFYTITLWQLKRYSNYSARSQWYGYPLLHVFITAIAGGIALFFSLAPDKLSLAWLKLMWVLALIIVGQWLALTSLTEKRDSHLDTGE